MDFMMNDMLLLIILQSTNLAHSGGEGRRGQRLHLNAFGLDGGISVLWLSLKQLTVAKEKKYVLFCSAIGEGEEINNLFLIIFLS